jgi:hypothetical protein
VRKASKPVNRVIICPHSEGYGITTPSFSNFYTTSPATTLRKINSRQSRFSSEGEIQ